MIDLYSAIAQMRKISAEGGHFTFSFISYNHETGKSEGMKVVDKAKLRPAASPSEIAEADYKLFYFDAIKREPRNCWQPLLTQFNGKRIQLN